MISQSIYYNAVLTLFYLSIICILYVIYYIDRQVIGNTFYFFLYENAKMKNIFFFLKHLYIFIFFLSFRPFFLFISEIITNIPPIYISFTYIHYTYRRKTLYILFALSRQALRTFQKIQCILYKYILSNLTQTI